MLIKKITVEQYLHTWCILNDVFVLAKFYLFRKGFYLAGMTFTC